MGWRIGILLPTASAGLITGMLAVVSCVSFAALIFAGELQPNLAQGMGLMLLAAIPVLAGVALFSSYPGTIAIPQDRIAPILALIASAIAEAMPGGESAVARYHTVAAAIVVASVACALTLWQGLPLLAYFPRFVLGGLLLFLGLSLLRDWLIDGWRRLPRGDYLVVVMILCTVSTAGYLAGVAVGLVGAVVLFVVNYSRIDVVKHDLTGTDQRSNVDRPGIDERALRSLGGSVRVLKLQGYIFFGTANRLLLRVRNLVESDGSPERLHVVLDFRRVSGMDSSAEMSFQKLCQLAQRRGFVLVFCSAQDEVARQLAQVTAHSAEHVAEFSELDYALEWCEDRLLDSARKSRPSRDHDATAAELEAMLGLGGVDPELKQYLERVDIAPGEYLIRQGDDADALYVLESGHVSVYLETGPGERIRLRKMGAGTVTGELGIYLGGRRNASVIADEHTVAWRLGRRGLSRMEQGSPHLAVRFHRAMAGLLSARLVSTNKTLRAVLD